MKKGLGFLIFNFLGLQATWAACAYGATHEFPMLGLYVGLAYITTHLLLSKMRTRDIKIMLIIGVIGIVIDSTFTQLNILSFPGFVDHQLPIPAWLMVLWFVFALMVPYSLYWLGKNLKIAAIAGAIGGSLSYLLGHKLGALNLGDPVWLSFGIYFIKWGILFPIALLIVKYFTQATIKSEITDSAF
ncbi:MAG: DUF2878 domain-containing protein [Pseudomonadota bacterium]